MQTTDQQDLYGLPFDVRDGLGIRLLQHLGIGLAFLSGGRCGSTAAAASGCSCLYSGGGAVRELAERLLQALGD